uniref:Uncharacterized protein n=1 Tax=Oryza punctata TaxID=4537 RepID=A0A0E0LVA8_ORYPU
MLLRLGEVRTLVVSSPEAVMEVMKTHDVAFATRAVTPTSSILSYGARDIVFAPFGRYLRELRKLCALELLSARRVRSFRHVREEEAARLVRSVAAAASSPAPAMVVNVSELVMIAANDIIMRGSATGAHSGRSIDQGSRHGHGSPRRIQPRRLVPGSRLARVLGGRSLRAAKQVNEKLYQITDTIIQGHEIKDNTVGEDEARHGHMAAT